jgi:hypothetical protein
MALTALQRDICRLLAERRVRSGESDVAGAVALNVLLGGSRLSHDLDLFHDTEEAVAASWEADRATLREAGYQVTLLRERPGLVEAVVERHGTSVRLEWARDSAFRFFPLVEHPELGLALHPFDLATNKVLALAGRREARDWVDLIHCHGRLQPLGYLVWAACGKDPGFGPPALLAHLRRAGRFSREEIAELVFAAGAPDPAALARTWHAASDQAEAILEALPPEEAGTCVLLGEDDLCRLDPGELERALAERRVRFRSGSIRGAFPSIRPARS